MRLRLLSICLLTLALSAAPALAEHDMVQFGSNIRVAQGQTIHDAVCFFCGVDDKGTIEGDVVVFFGSVHIAGNAHHDVVSFFGNISVDDNASIEHDMVNFFGNIRLGHNVTIGKDMVSMFGNYRAEDTATVGGDRVVEPGWIFYGPLGVFLLVLIVVVREFRAHRRRQLYMRGYPYPPPQ